MTIFELWNKIGKQHLKNTKGIKAKVFIDGEEYIITKVIYEGGKIIGFNAEAENGKE